jgi:hypothetical protein
MLQYRRSPVMDDFSPVFNGNAQMPFLLVKVSGHHSTGSRVLAQIGTYDTSRQVAGSNPVETIGFVSIYIIQRHYIPWGRFSL